MPRWQGAISLQPAGSVIAGRYLSAAGGAPNAAQSSSYGLKGDDIATASFATIELGYVQENSATRRRRLNAARSAMQISVCKDGSVNGKSSMIPLNTDTQTECNDGTNNVKYGPIDSAFRAAVSVARFQLIKKMQGA